MSGSNWSRNVAFGLAALVVAGLLVFSYQQFQSAGYQQALIERHADNQAQKENESARRSSEQRCGDIATTTKRVECKHETEQERQSAEREIRDLEAQRIMALWTRYMGLAAIVGTSVGIIGVGLVFLTFAETRRTAEAGREANQIARDAGQRQLRAYITVEEDQFSNLRVSGKGKFSVQVYNRGQTPAYNVRANYEVFLIDSQLGRLPIRFGAPMPEIKSSLGPGQNMGMIAFLSDDITINDMKNIEEGSWTIVFAGIVVYQDAFKKTRRTLFKYVVDTDDRFAENDRALVIAATGNRTT